MEEEELMPCPFVILGKERKLKDLVSPRSLTETDIGHHSSAKVKVCNVYCIHYSLIK